MQKTTSPMRAAPTHHEKILTYFAGHGVQTFGWADKHADGAFILLIYPPVFLRTFVAVERQNFPAMDITNLTKPPPELWAQTVFEALGHFGDAEHPVPAGSEPAFGFIRDVPGWLSAGTYLAIARSPKIAKVYIGALLRHAEPGKTYTASLHFKEEIARFKFAEREAEYRAVVMAFYQTLK